MGHCVVYLSVSENTPEGRRVTKLDQILLNGNNIAMLVPGSEYPFVVYLTIIRCMKVATVHIVGFY